jgi:transcriptional regulator of acetoin/glycerol metabolism
VEGFNYIGTDWMMATSGCFPIYYYQTADGTKISVTDNIYETPEEAKQDIQEFIRRAKRVIEQSLVIDENGDQIGERVIVQVQARLPYEKPAQLIWTEGRRWFKVEGRTAEQLLAFESRYKATK